MAELPCGHFQTSICIRCYAVDGSRYSGWAR
jgi:hypothetical protein